MHWSDRRPSKAWLFSVLGPKSASPFLSFLRSSASLCWTLCTGCGIPAAEPQYVGKNPALKVEELQEVQLPLVLCDSFRFWVLGHLWVRWANVAVGDLVITTSSDIPDKLTQMEICLTLLAHKNKTCFFVSLISSKLGITKKNLPKKTSHLFHTIF